MLFGGVYETSVEIRTNPFPSNIDGETNSRPAILGKTRPFSKAAFNFGKTIELRKNLIKVLS